MEALSSVADVHIPPLEHVREAALNVDCCVPAREDTGTHTQNTHSIAHTPHTFLRKQQNEVEKEERAGEGGDAPWHTVWPRGQAT